MSPQLFYRLFSVPVILAAFCLFVPGHARSETNKFFQAPGTRRMAERLMDWSREFGAKNPYDTSGVLEQAKARVEAISDLSQRLPAQMELANFQLIAGNAEQAVLLISNVFTSASANRISLGPSTRRELRLMQALAWLRVGEQENCLEHHNPDSCLLPIKSAAQHHHKRGATNAETIFLDLVRERPDDLASRWLLNITAMTLGHYPDAVPPAMRIPPSVFNSDYPEKKFPEIASKVGLAVDDIAGGTIAEDFDGDGLLDVLLTSWSPTNQCHYFKNMGNGQFEERTEQAGLFGVTGGLNAIQGDYNNDGWPDIYIVRGAWLGEIGNIPDSLLRNNGDGTFSDVTEEAGLLSFHPALSAVWLDANNDGWLDLFVGNETQKGGSPHLCQLFINDGHGHFRECAVAAGAGVEAFVRGVTAGDFDNDGWPDLYVSCLFSDNILLRNDGRSGTNTAAGVHFTDVTAKARVQEPSHSFPTWFFDYDNDGWLDIFASGYGKDNDPFSTSVNVGHAMLREIVADKLGLPSKGTKARLFHNNGDGSFRDVSHEAHLDHVLLAMGSNFGDLDNDGWLDFYLGTGAPSFGSLVPNEMFRNNEGRSFQNVTSAGGFGHLQKGHAIAFADLNNDGQQDVLLNVGGSFRGDNYFDALFANPGHDNHWICLSLKGRQSNRSAIGARIKIVARVGQGTREIHRVVGSGGSFGSSPLRQEIGLGHVSAIERVEFWWPATGKTNVVQGQGIAMDHFYEFTEGGASVQPLKPATFPWPGIQPIQNAAAAPAKQ
jgi:hypothetical protein